MTTFRKKPVVIEATQWFKNGDHPMDYPADGHVDPVSGNVYTAEYMRVRDWEGHVVRRFRRPDVDGAALCEHEHCRKPMHDHGWIDTLEGGHTVCPGDFIITGIKGEHYPCKPDIFEATYEPA